MEIFWYVVLIGMLAVYVILDGYDFGAGIIHLFFAKKEEDKKLITKSIGPFWDANEVWLIAAGGLLFFAFPTLYASAFSGFYLPLIMILWLLIFRAIGLELREQVHHPMWHSIWDKAFGVASLLLALFFGLALGNVVRGVNLGDVENGISTCEPQYFFLPLWNSTFSPTIEHLGVIDWFTLLVGVVSVLSLTIHGANWIILKTNSELKVTLKSAIVKMNVVLLVLVVLSVILLHYVVSNPFSNFIKYPWLILFPLLLLAGLFGQFAVQKFKKEGTGFLLSSAFLLGGVVSSALVIFPKLLPSNNTINPSLTLYNTITDAYALSVGFNWFVIGLFLVILYFVIQHRVFKGKMDGVDYGEH